MKRLLIFLFLLTMGFFLVFPTSSSALPSVNISIGGGTTWFVDDVGSYATGEAMVGIEVVTYFSTGNIAAVDWVASGMDVGAYGNVFGATWSLTQTGNTYDNLWTLAYLSNDDPSMSIDTISINGLPGNIAFDTNNLVDLTDFSSVGRNFEVSSLSPGNVGGYIDVRYSDPVALTGETPLGDLYRFLSFDLRYLEITNPTTGETEPFSFGPGSTLTFYADTDPFNGGFGPGPGEIPPIPEPGTMLLLGSGLAGLVALKRKFKKS